MIQFLSFPTCPTVIRADAVTSMELYLSNSILIKTTGGNVSIPLPYNAAVLDGGRHFLAEAIETWQRALRCQCL